MSERTREDFELKIRLAEDLVDHTNGIERKAGIEHNEEEAKNAEARKEAKNRFCDAHSAKVHFEAELADLRREFDAWRVRKF